MVTRRLIEGLEMSTNLVDVATDLIVEAWIIYGPIYTIKYPRGRITSVHLSATNLGKLSSEV